MADVPQFEAQRRNATQSAGPSSVEKGRPEELEDRGNPIRGNREKSSDGEVGLPGRESGENDADGTSPKQVAANRRNAMRSTGPRTSKGKEASKFNATKHGLRASEMVIPGREDPLEFETLLQEFWDDWMPHGRTEISLVSEIAIAQWRLRRAHRAELGEIRNGIVDATARDPAEEIADRNAFTPLPEKSTKQIERLKVELELAMGELASKGTISRGTCDRFDSTFGNEAENPALLLRVWFFDEMPDTLRKSLPEGIKVDKRAAARVHLEECWEELERLRRKARRREKLAAEIKVQRHSIPKGFALETIQRYETAIKRDMYRAIDQLERLQRRRGGEPTLPAVNVHLSHDD